MPAALAVLSWQIFRGLQEPAHANSGRGSTGSLEKTDLMYFTLYPSSATSICEILRGWPVLSILVVCSCWNWEFGSPGDSHWHCHYVPVAVLYEGILQARGKEQGLAENAFSLPSPKAPVTQAFSFWISSVLSFLVRTFQCHLYFFGFPFSRPLFSDLNHFPRQSLPARCQSAPNSSTAGFVHSFTCWWDLRSRWDNSTVPCPSSSKTWQ